MEERLEAKIMYLFLTCAGGGIWCQYASYFMTFKKPMLIQMEFKGKGISLRERNGRNPAQQNYLTKADQFSMNFLNPNEPHVHSKYNGTLNHFFFMSNHTLLPSLVFACNGSSPFPKKE